jgi:hypothetical protein
LCAKDGKVCGISADTLKAGCVAKPGDEKPTMPAPEPVPCSAKLDAHKALCEKCKPGCAAPKACTVAVDADGKLPPEAKCEAKPPTGGPEMPPPEAAPKPLDCKDLPPALMTSTDPSHVAMVTACKTCKASECGKKAGAACKLVVDDQGEIVPGPAVCTGPAAVTNI